MEIDFGPPGGHFIAVRHWFAPPMSYSLLSPYEDPTFNSGAVRSFECPSGRWQLIKDQYSLFVGMFRPARNGDIRLSLGVANEISACRLTHLSA